MIQLLFFIYSGLSSSGSNRLTSKFNLSSHVFFFQHSGSSKRRDYNPRGPCGACTEVTVFFFHLSITHVKNKNLFLEGDRLLQKKSTFLLGGSQAS